ncbi:SanA/YdcF family protein [Rhodococcus sp. MEB064]|uniref:SanA/YdcF family protein n=1 Tax=Rhodococcus sp. MEB064 TaxID=1587522 RepID=UPI000AEAE6F0|nr:ElyC/SanA/YdcF family protein [Rhodococcus sp. MEB064]
MTSVGRRRVAVAVSVALVAVTAVVVGSASWVALASHGRMHDAADAPTAPVAIVLGARVQNGEPSAFLRGRLDAALRLMEDGTVRALLLSGNANGASGDEIAVMTDYLVDRGVDPSRIVVDGVGLTTYDTCLRAVTTYGVGRAIVVSQGTHVSRAVALCRAVGLDADGVIAACDCSRRALLRQFVRELLARPKAVLDVLRGRPPAVSTPATDEVQQAAR